MKRNVWFITWILTLQSLIASSQEVISSVFTLDTIVPLPAMAVKDGLSHLRCTVCGGFLYYLSGDALQSDATGWSAQLHAISMDNYASASYAITLPKSSSKTEKNTRNLYITDIWLTHDTLVLSTENRISIFHKNLSERFEHDTTFVYPFRGIKMSYLYQGELYFLNEDHDRGYDWYRQHLHNGEPSLICTLPYEAPHVVQANPNRYLFRDDHFVYFLSTRFPLLKKHLPDGTWVEDIRFNLPNWHPFGDEYIQKSLSVPYGIERIMATKDNIFEYSYPKVVLPVGGALLLYYTQYDTLLHRSHYQFALQDESGQCVLLTAKDTSANTYGSERFPFNLFDQHADLGRTSWNDRLIEFVLDDTLDWRDLTPQQYQRAQEQFFRRQDPIPSIRVMTYRNSNPLSQPIFLDADHHLLSLMNLPTGKNIVMINNELECSACRHELLEYLDSTDSLVHIGILYPFVPGALQERSITKEIAAYMSRAHQLYFLQTKRKKQYPRYIHTATATYPMMMLYETGKAPIFIPLDRIYEPGVTTLTFSEEFRNAMAKFLSKE